MTARGEQFVSRSRHPGVKLTDGVDVDVALIAGVVLMMLIQLCSAFPALVLAVNSAALRLNFDFAGV